MLKAALLDIDGTFLDSNDAHAHAWVEALQRHGHVVPYEKVRPLIGKGGDKLLSELLGVDDESDEGRAIADERRTLFSNDLLPNLKPTPGARALLQRLRADGLRLVVATSASGEELDGLLRQAGIADLIDGAASSSDANASKPDPDIVEAALRRAGVRPDEAVLIGDTPHDIEAGTAAGVATVALRCGGGWNDEQLDGATHIYDDPADLLARLDDSPLGTRTASGQTESNRNDSPTTTDAGSEHGAQAVDPLNKDSSGPGGTNYGGLRDTAPANSQAPQAPTSTYADTPADSTLPANHFGQRQAQNPLPDPAVVVIDPDHGGSGNSRPS